MKRSYLGLGLLLALLLGSVLATKGMVCRTETVTKELTAAANNALVGNWEEAEESVESALDDWEESRPFTAAFADHTPLEDIEDDFAQLKIYLRTREKEAFAATAAQLAKKVEAVGEAHTLSWQNIL